MTEEEYFRKTYPDSCYGDKPLSPYWDFFQDGVEFGERQSEQKIENLEQQIEEMKCCGNCKWNDLETKLVHPPCKDCNWDLDKWEIKEK